MLKFCPVNPGSKAALRGIREGDFITSINNQSTKDITNAEAHTLLRNSGDTLKLGLNEDTNRSPKRRQYKTVHQETHSETVKKSSVTSYTVTSLETSNHNGTSKPPCSSSSSSTSTYTSLPSPSGMADNGRSRRKKSKNQRKKNKYQVESPKRIKSPERKKPVKSRSLDDDSVKIEELSENDAKNDSSTSSTALVLEVESDQEVEEPPLMSPEEELTLRNFLEGLNLVKSPEEALGQVHSTIESVKSRRAQKRAALEQYFNPIVQNPRFLDVISEETSDLSDREQQTRISHHLKQGTPEPEVTPKLRKRRRILENPVLVGTRIIEVPNVEQVASTSLVEGSTRAEVVFLEDSSPEEVGELTPPPTPKNEKVFAQSDQITQKDTETSTSTSTSELDTEVTESSKPIPQIVEEKLETSLDLQLLSNLEGTSDQFSNCSSTAFEETSQKVELDFPILPVSSLEATKSNLQLEEQLSSNVDPELTTQQSFKLEAEEFKEMDYFEPVSTSETPQLEQLTPNKGYESESSNTTSETSNSIPEESLRIVDCALSVSTSSVAKECEAESKMLTNSDCESASSKILNQERFPNFGRSEKTSQKASTTSQLSKNLKSVEQLSTDTEYESESSKSTFKTTVNKTFSTIPSESSHFIPSSDSKAKLEEQLSTDTEYESESTSKTSDKRTVRTENLTNLRNFSSMYNERVQKTDFVPLSSRMSKSEQFLTNKENNDEFSKTTFNKKNQSTSKPSSKVIIHKINLEPTKTVPEPNAPKTEELFENVDSFLPNSFSTSKISKSEVSTHKETKSEFSKSTFNKQSSSKPFSKEIIHKIELEPRRTEPEIFDPFSPTKIVEDSKSFSTSKISKSEQISTNKGEFSKSTIDKENLSNSKPFSKEIIHKIELEPTRTESETEKLSKTFYPFAHTKIIEDSKAFSTSSSSFRSEKTLEKHFSSLQFSKNANSDQKITKPVEIIHKIVLSDDDNNSKSGLEETNPKPLEIIHKILRSEKTEEANRSVTPPLESQEFKVSIHQEPHHYDKNQNKNSSKKDQEKSEISENGNIPESPSKEVESLCLTPRPQVSTTILSPPAPSRSPSSGSSTSFCTTKRLSTSIADISSITSNPQTLREICLYFLLSQPFGAAVLQELADVSSSLQRLTTSTPQFISSHHDPTSAPRNMNSARLQARDLTEWLHHARSKNRNDRRNSLPNAQMLYLQQKEQEIETELKRLEEEKQRLEEEMEHKFRIEDYHISKRGDFAESKKRPVSLPSEFFRQQMYNEYMDKIAQMEQRKLEKQIKVSQIELTTPETKPSGISDEFMSKVRLKQQLGKLQKPESESEHEDELLPKHLQEFVEFGCSKKGKEAKRISKLLGKNRRVFSLLEEIDAELITAKGFLLGRVGQMTGLVYFGVATLLVVVGVGSSKRRVYDRARVLYER
ncbi:hypothetical protein TcasGA2_TC031396 [Tribolium castaneum]|uniref:PDZ domain-containing protein n=1 Tax=Tribolium castaneum TaxID=7070 RepID=A0A139WAC3_TRICA|nr:hypothetical protein TcasGA2_TC031396 [Tribolium castaneum]